MTLFQEHYFIILSFIESCHQNKTAGGAATSMGLLCFQSRATRTAHSLGIVVTTVAVVTLRI